MEEKLYPLRDSGGELVKLGDYGDGTTAVVIFTDQGIAKNWIESESERDEGVFFGAKTWTGTPTSDLVGELARETTVTHVRYVRPEGERIAEKTDFLQFL